MVCHREAFDLPTGCPKIDIDLSFPDIYLCSAPSFEDIETPTRCRAADNTPNLNSPGGGCPYISVEFKNKTPSRGMNISLIVSVVEPEGCLSKHLVLHPKDKCYFTDKTVIVPASFYIKGDPDNEPLPASGGIKFWNEKRPGKDCNPKVQITVAAPGCRYGKLSLLEVVSFRPFSSEITHHCTCTKYPWFTCTGSPKLSVRLRALPGFEYLSVKIRQGRVAGMASARYAVKNRVIPQIRGQALHKRGFPSGLQFSLQVPSYRLSFNVGGDLYMERRRLDNGNYHFYLYNRLPGRTGYTGDRGNIGPTGFCIECILTYFGICSKGDKNCGSKPPPPPPTQPPHSVPPVPTGSEPSVPTGSEPSVPTGSEPSVPASGSTTPSDPYNTWRRPPTGDCSCGMNDFDLFNHCGEGWWEYCRSEPSLLPPSYPPPPTGGQSVPDCSGTDCLPEPSQPSYQSEPSVPSGSEPSYYEPSSPYQPPNPCCTDVFVRIPPVIHRKSCSNSDVQYVRAFAFTIRDKVDIVLDIDAFPNSSTRYMTEYEIDAITRIFFF